MKNVIFGAAALSSTFMIGLLVADVFYRNNNPDIGPVVLPPISFQSQTSNDRFSLSLCEFAANALAFREKEVVTEASHIGLLSSQRFSVLRKCGARSVSASVTLLSKDKLPESLVLQLIDLMDRRRESIDAAPDKVIVTGVVEVGSAGSHDFDIVATDVQVVVAPLIADVPTHNKRLQRTRW